MKKKVQGDTYEAMAAGISKQELTHKEVQETADRVTKLFKKLITEIVESM